MRKSTSFSLQLSSRRDLMQISSPTTLLPRLSRELHVKLGRRKHFGALVYPNWEACSSVGNGIHYSLEGLGSAFIFPKSERFIPMASSSTSYLLTRYRHLLCISKLNRWECHTMPFIATWLSSTALCTTSLTERSYCRPGREEDLDSEP